MGSDVALPVLTIKITFAFHNPVKYAYPRSKFREWAMRYGTIEFEATDNVLGALDTLTCHMSADRQERVLAALVNALYARLDAVLAQKYLRDHA